VLGILGSGPAAEAGNSAALAALLEASLRRRQRHGQRLAPFVERLLGEPFAAEHALRERVPAPG
jgi:hypothetical protein